ncbi:MAG: peroxide stress protein YaaA [Actinomycetota bacterium]|jgi:cytoplasmic iron level regulating protein YaaA (DUF328/UPF0246 family)
MLILLPPSEGKTSASSNQPFELSHLSFPELSVAREKVLAKLISLSKKPATARTALKLSPHQNFELERNVSLRTAFAAPAREIYSGVLYEAMGLKNFTDPQLKRAQQRVLITSSLFGFVRPNDEIPAYRLSGDSPLPVLGSPANHWKKHLSPVVNQLGANFIVDMRSGTYTKFWTPNPKQAAAAVTIKIMQEVGTGSAKKRLAVTHFNKATKGRIAKFLATTTKIITDTETLIRELNAQGWKTELVETPAGKPDILEVLITEI